MVSTFTSIHHYGVTSASCPTLQFLQSDHKMVEKYAFWVTLRHTRFMRRGKTELRTLHTLARRSQAPHFKTYFSVSLPPQYWYQAVTCVSIPRMQRQSRYFLVIKKWNIDHVSIFAIAMTKDILKLEVEINHALKWEVLLFHTRNSRHPIIVSHTDFCKELTEQK